MRLRIAVTPELVKAEAERRILQAWPLWRQINTLSGGGEAVEAMRAEIGAIRAASNALETRRPIPPDFANETYWSQDTNP